MHVLSREHQFTEWQHVCESVHFDRMRCGYHGSCRLMHIVRCREVQGCQRECRVHGLRKREVLDYCGSEHVVDVLGVSCECECDVFEHGDSCLFL